MDATHAPTAAEGAPEPELSGINGWLLIVALGQGLGILYGIAALFQYRGTGADFEKFPVAMWGEVVLNVAMLLFAVYTAVLFWSHSRKFPRVFIAQLIAVVLLPAVATVWAAFALSRASDLSFTELVVVLAPTQAVQAVSAVISAAIWIPYTLRSRRVANTFVR